MLEVRNLVSGVNTPWRETERGADYIWLLDWVMYTVLSGHHPLLLWYRNKHVTGWCRWKCSWCVLEQPFNELYWLSMHVKRDHKSIAHCVPQNYWNSLQGNGNMNIMLSSHWLKKVKIFRQCSVSNERLNCPCVRLQSAVLTRKLLSN